MNGNYIDHNSYNADCKTSKYSFVYCIVDMTQSRWHNKRTIKSSNRKVVFEDIVLSFHLIDKRVSLAYTAMVRYRVEYIFGVEYVLSARKEQRESRTEARSRDPWLSRQAFCYPIHSSLPLKILIIEPILIRLFCFNQYYLSSKYATFFKYLVYL